MFFCTFCEMFQNTTLYRTPPVSVSVTCAETDFRPCLMKYRSSANHCATSSRSNVCSRADSTMSIFLFSVFGPRPHMLTLAFVLSAPLPHKIFRCYFWLFTCLCYKVLMCYIIQAQFEFSELSIHKYYWKQRPQLQVDKKLQEIWEIFTNNTNNK